MWLLWLPNLSMGATPKSAVAGPIHLVAGEVYVGGVQEGQDYIGGVQRGESYVGGVQEGQAT